MIRLALAAFIAAQVLFVAPATAQLKEDSRRVNALNQFATSLLTLHTRRIEGRDIETATASGGYSGTPDFYRETRYTDAATGNLLAIIQRETKKPDVVHAIELFVYDKQGRVIRDYYARYLPGHRNAPVQAIVNLHGYGDGLHGFRQFESGGDVIYEACRGDYVGENIDISLDEDLLPPTADIKSSEPYRACFDFVSPVIGKYLDPLAELSMKVPGSGRRVDSGDVGAVIRRLTGQIKDRPEQAELYIRRGEAYFLVHEFDAAIADYSTAIRLDGSLNQAWFGRGMALGRAGRIAEGIADLSVYIKRNPNSSVAYTKRGVRYIWLGDHERAEVDLRRAIELDADNAEANDDLGVIKALKGKPNEARDHFLRTIELDPSYQKAYHNLAMVYQMSGKSTQALEAINGSLKLDPEGRDSLLLKGNILDSLGRLEEARAFRDAAGKQPEGNWSERLGAQ
ncbi:MAG: tetratricopeptide repeat protein [Alphaproteobacteria bacterium]